MAVISSAGMLYFDPVGSQRCAVYRLVNVNTGDTIDVSSVGSVTFRKVTAATFVAGSGAAVGTVTINGTVLTLTLGGMSADTVTLLVEGQG